MKKAKLILPAKNQAPASVEAKSNLRNAYSLKRNTLTSLSVDQINSSSLSERKFRSAKEIGELIIRNGKVLFGEHTITVPVKMKNSVFNSGSATDIFVLDIADLAKPKFYVVAPELITGNFYDTVFPKITWCIALMKNEGAVKVLCENLVKSKGIKKELQPKLRKGDVFEYLKNAIRNKPTIVLVSPNEIKEAKELEAAYPEAGQRLKPVQFRKYGKNGSTICTFNPPFSEINLKEKKKKNGVPMTEENHLGKASDVIKEVFKKMKTDLLKTDRSIQFNPQTYYISLRKDRNIAFFHFSRKRISLVVKNPERETRKLIKHHEVKSLTEKVQKFWNGPSCTIVIENDKYLNEVIALLKKLITS